MSLQASKPAQYPFPPSYTAEHERLAQQDAGKEQRSLELKECIFKLCGRCLGFRLQVTWCHRAKGDTQGRSRKADTR